MTAEDTIIRMAQALRIAEATARAGIRDDADDELMTPATWLLWFELRTRAIHAGYTDPGDLGEHRATFRAALRIRQAVRAAAWEAAACPLLPLPAWARNGRAV